MTGPVPRHDHQSVDQWAQQGLVNSRGRTSPESDLPEAPDLPGASEASDAGGPTAAGIPTDPGAPPRGDRGDSGDAEPEYPEHTGAGGTGGEPGTVRTPGDAAETAAFEGDGAYSEGWAASGPPAG